MNLHKYIKDPKKNRMRNIVLAIRNLETQIDKPKDIFEATVLDYIHNLRGLYFANLVSEELRRKYANTKKIFKKKI